MNNGKVVAPEYLLLPPELGQAILNYLAGRPYLEVFELVAGCRRWRRRSNGPRHPLRRKRLLDATGNIYCCGDSHRPDDADRQGNEPERDCDHDRGSSTVRALTLCHPARKSLGGGLPS